VDSRYSRADIFFVLFFFFFLFLKNIDFLSRLFYVLLDFVFFTSYRIS